MGNILGTALTALTLTVGVHSADVREDQTEGIAEAFTRLGWRCAAPVAGEALTCVGEIEDYPRPVAFLIPRTFVTPDRLDLILHLHGDNASNSGLAPYLTAHRPARALERSGRSAALVFPLSHSGPSGYTHDYAERLAPPGGFESFLHRVLAVAVAAGVSARPELASLAMTGHSGAYRTIAAILESGVAAGPIREVGLIDALYGQLPRFEQYAAGGNDRRFWSAYSVHGSLGVRNSCLMERLAAAGVTYFGCAPFEGACGERPRRRAGCTPHREAPPVDDWRANRVGFLQTALEHNPAAPVFLEVFLSRP